MNTSSVPSSSVSFDLTACHDRIVSLIRDRPDLQLTLQHPVDKCIHYCGDGYGSYSPYDAGEMIVTWVVPLLQLSVNMNVVEIATKWLPYASKVFVLSHQFADPIGVSWSLATKLELRRQLWEYLDARLAGTKCQGASQEIANLCYYLHDFGYERYETFVDRLGDLVEESNDHEIYEELEAVSQDLSLNRVRNRLPIAMAIVVYVAAIFASLLHADYKGSLAAVLPHTIALRVLCYFLILQIILSAAVGG